MLYAIFNIFFYLHYSPHNPTARTPANPPPLLLKLRRVLPQRAPKKGVHYFFCLQNEKKLFFIAHSGITPRQVRFSRGPAAVPPCGQLNPLGASPSKIWNKFKTTKYNIWISFINLSKQLFI